MAEKNSELKQVEYMFTDDGGDIPLNMKLYNEIISDLDRLKYNINALKIIESFVSNFPK